MQLFLKFSILLFAFFSPSLATLLEESVSFCEHYVECESASRMQERLCLGNSVANPFWLPSNNATHQQCYILLRNDYLYLERLDRQLESQMLSCLIEQTLPLSPSQENHCDASLMETVRTLRHANGSLILDHCFQGSEQRVSRQCGKLRDCCHAHQQCAEIVKQSFMVEKRTLQLETIRKKAVDCENGLPVTKMELEDEPALPKKDRRPQYANDTKGGLLNGTLRVNFYTREEVEGEKGLAIVKEVGEGAKQQSESGDRSINFNGNSKSNTVDDKEVDDAMKSLIRAALASMGPDASPTTVMDSSKNAEQRKLTQVEPAKQRGNAKDRLCAERFPGVLTKSANRLALLKRVFKLWYEEMKLALEEERQKTVPPAKVTLDTVLLRPNASSNVLITSNATKFGDDYPDADALIADTLCIPVDDDGSYSEWFDDSLHKVNGIWNDWEGDIKSGRSGEIDSREQFERYLKSGIDQREDHIPLSPPNSPQQEMTKLRPCDEYMSCRQQVVLGLDKCGEMSNRHEGSTGLFSQSTESLLQQGDKCNGRNFELFVRLNAVVLRRNQRLYTCLNESTPTKAETCSREDPEKMKNIIERLSRNEYRHEADCYADANSLQFACARLRTCCPSFFRCREETSDAESEREILLLTSQLVAENYRCRTGMDAKKEMERPFQTTKEGFLNRFSMDIYEEPSTVSSVDTSEWIRHHS